MNNRYVNTKNPATALKGIETVYQQEIHLFDQHAKNPATALKGIETKMVVEHHYKS